MKLSSIYLKFDAHLQAVEEGMRLSLHTSQPTLRDSSLHSLDSGGKRLRPLLVLLAGSFGKQHDERVIDLAVSMELIHMATLVHDDVIDNATLRRGRKTIRALWTDQLAMITGDYIFSRSLEKVTQLENPEVHRIFSKTLLEMCKGEIVQYKNFFNYHVSVRHYLHRIKRKTALLFAISCQLGAMVTEAKPHIIGSLYYYGYYVGMAFQLIDDILDIVSEESILGKPVGSDIKQGNITLPVIIALRSSPDKDKLYRYLESKGEAESLQDILSIVKKSDGMEHTRRLAKKYLEKAEMVISHIPQVWEKESLYLITQLFSNRVY